MLVCLSALNLPRIIYLPNQLDSLSLLDLLDCAIVFELSMNADHTEPHKSPDRDTSLTSL